MNRLRFSVLAGMVLTAALSRLIHHPPNFSPITAIALFGGAQFATKRSAFLVPLAAMFLSDLILGFHGLMPVIYACFALFVCFGFWLRKHRSAGNIFLVTLLASVLFFLISNFGVWGFSSMYPKTTLGLASCFLLAIPYFPNTVLGDLAYSVVLFGGLWLTERTITKTREPSTQPG